jgi:hypothetical protein
MTYRNAAKSQLDGTPYAQSNCGATVAGRLADTATLGFWSPGGGVVRNWTGDTSGGIDYTTLASAIKSHTGETLTVLYFAPPSTLDDILDAPRVTGLSILCSVTVNTPYHTGNYTGRHCVEVGAKRTVNVKRADGTTYAQKQAYVMDPGKGPAYVGWQWWPWSLLMKAAKASTGTDAIHLIYTRDLADTKRTAKADGGIHATADTGGTLVGSVKSGTAYSVAATLKGGGYSANGHTCYGWSELGAGKFVAGRSLR